MTHRPGRSWRVTIIDQQPHGDQLHAIVMAGRVLTTDPELAERVSALLNASDRALADSDGHCDGTCHGHADGAYGRGAREALAEVRRQLDAWLAATDVHFEAQRRDIDNLALGWLRQAAAELGVDENPPPSPPSATQTAQKGSVGGTGSTETATGLSGPPETVHLIRQDYGTTGCCHRVPSALPLTDRLTLHPEAVTCGHIEGDDVVHCGCIRCSHQRQPEAAQAPMIVTRDQLTGHIDDPVCTCAQCHPEWHTGVRCNCPTCRERKADQ